MNPVDDRLTKGGYTVDEPREFERSMDPFMVMLRETNPRRGRDHFCEDGTMARQAGEFVEGSGRLRDDVVMKMIWWFVGVVSEDGNSLDEVAGRELDPGAKIVSMPWNEAVARCTFADDGEVVGRAINIVRDTFGI